MGELVQKTLPGAGSFNWAKVEVLAGELRVMDMPRLMEYFLYKKDQEAFGDNAVRHLVLGELESDGTFQVFMGAADKDHFYWTQEEVERAGRPHLLGRAGEGPQRHMQVSQDHFMAMYYHLGPHSPQKWWPSIGKEANGLVGINWKHKETGQILVDTPPPIG